MSSSSLSLDLPLPPMLLETPCFVILEDAVVHNLHQTARAAGGVDRLMPHVKTHRAPWIVSLMLSQGVKAFKAATPAEVEIVAAAGAPMVVWAYPTANPVAIKRVADAGRRTDTRLEALVDSQEGIDAWLTEIASSAPFDIGLRVDLDPGLGRTGVPIDARAIGMAQGLSRAGLFAGWHAYDGHVTEQVKAEREIKVGAVLDRVRSLMADARADDLTTDLIAAGSYSFDIWPHDVARWVSPGSFTFSSSQHHADLADLDWRVAAYVLATVVSVHADTATLDAGSKAISPDMPVATRFVGPGPIRMVKEEHSVVETEALRVGDHVALVPRHACTAAYLYSRAMVQTISGGWEYRAQLGSYR